jgi:hypothetical protein
MRRSTLRVSKRVREVKGLAWRAIGARCPASKGATLGHPD